MGKWPQFWLHVSIANWWKNQDSKCLLRSDLEVSCKRNDGKIGISTVLCLMISAEHLGMHHVSTKFIPWLLMDEQKENWLNLCADFLQYGKVDENFVKYVAMGDGMWVWYWNEAAFFTVKVRTICKIEISMTE